MIDYLFSAEIVRVMLVVGVVVSVLFYEKVQLTTGGAIVPAYLAIALPRPLTVVLTLVAGYATFLVVNKVIARKWILYGRRKFEVELIVGLVFTAIGFGINLAVGGIDGFDLQVATIGFLVPGIIAHDMFRQSPKKTVMAIGGTIAILAAFLVVFATVLTLLGADIGPSGGLAGDLGFDPRLLLGAVALSVVVAIVVYARLGVRSGGFIGGACLALLAPRWTDVLFVAVVALLTWLIVVKLLMPRLLLFGRRKLSTMILVGAIVGWTLETVLVVATSGAYQPGAGLVVKILMVPALIANDAQRQGWGRTVLGVSTTSAGVFGLVNLLGAGLAALGLLA